MMDFGVVSWNIDARSPGLLDRLHRLHEFGADLVLLQEVPRSAASALQRLDGFAWAELAVLHSEPYAGPARRTGTAILGGPRVKLLDSGQVPAEMFEEAGAHAGLSRDEVRDIGWRHKTVYVDLEIDGGRVRACSFHARPGSGIGYVKQLFHRTCAEWLSAHDGTALFGVDANSPQIDAADPAQWRPFIAGEAALIGPRPRHHLVDALRRWLEAHPVDFDAVLRDRPNGPLAVSYLTPRQHLPRRYDHLFVTNDLGVVSIEHRPPGLDGSDHGMLVAKLTREGV